MKAMLMLVFGSFRMLAPREHGVAGEALDSSSSRLDDNTIGRSSLAPIRTNMRLRLPLVLVAAVKTDAHVLAESFRWRLAA